jgi:hypothetical protein
VASLRLAKIRFAQICRREEPMSRSFRLRRKPPRRWRGIPNLVSLADCILRQSPL